MVDKTGVSGIFDIHLDLAPEDLGLSSRGCGAAGEPASRPDPGDVAARIRASVQRLGLKLQPSRGPEEILVIDHAEKPGDN